MESNNRQIRVRAAGRKFRRRELVGLLLWIGAVGVIYGTLTLPFHVHLLMTFMWLVFSGAVFVAMSRANIRDAQGVFTESVEHIRDAQEHLLNQMAIYSEARDAFTGEHINRVKDHTTSIALQLGIPREEADAIGKAAVAHDLGKIGIPDNILGKPAKLSIGEFQTMKEHTVIGERVLGSSELFELERQCARHHHERWDGSGYPDGLSGEAIPLVARITAVADVFDALMSKRPYKEPWSREEAIRYLHDNAGTHFDPRVVAAFLRSQGEPVNHPAKPGVPASV